MLQWGLGQRRECCPIVGNFSRDLGSREWKAVTMRMKLDVDTMISQRLDFLPRHETELPRVAQRIVVHGRTSTELPCDRSALSFGAVGLSRFVKGFQRGGRMRAMQADPPALVGDKP